MELFFFFFYWQSNVSAEIESDSLGGVRLPAGYVSDKNCSSDS